MSQAIILKGITSIFWSAAGLLVAPAGAIVESCALTPVSVNVSIEGNAGATALKALLDDGFDAALECLYDGNKTWPAFGAIVGLKIPGQAVGADAAACAAALTAATAYACLVVKPPLYDTTSGRKKETMIRLALEFRPDLALVLP